jgi:hypothetical protein
MKTALGRAALSAVFAGALAIIPSAAFAQTYAPSAGVSPAATTAASPAASPVGGTTTTGTTTTTTSGGNTGWWGLIGLVGLLGLFGMGGRRSNTVVDSTTYDTTRRP